MLLTIFCNILYINLLFYATQKSLHKILITQFLQYFKNNILSEYFLNKLENLNFNKLKTLKKHIIKK